MRLCDLVEAYIDYKRSLGMRFVSDAAVLRSFCRAMGDINVEAVKPEPVLAFIAGTGPVTTRWGLKCCILRGLYRYAQERGWVSMSPLPPDVPKLPPPLTPYITVYLFGRRTESFGGRNRYPTNAPVPPESRNHA